MLDGLLGRQTETPRAYTPEVLTSFSRVSQRKEIGFDASQLNCTGSDVWECYELTWLDEIYIPQVAELRVTIPASSSKTFESKSMKLYLGSFAYTRFHNAQHVKATIEEDLELRLECHIDLEMLDRSTLSDPSVPTNAIFLNGEKTGWPRDLDPKFALYDEPGSHLLSLKSNSLIHANYVCDSFYCLCPVTAQPDQARIIIGYKGYELDARRLLAYLVSYRSTGSFHETNIERIYKDLWERLNPNELKVEGRFLRRGGISINPIRQSFERDDST